MYVLKNIGDFVNAVARNEQVFYGKELEFYHHPEAFTPESRPLVRFLQYSLLKGSSYMGNYLSTVYKRDLNVTPELIDDFLDVAGAGPLMGETADGIAREWSFREGEPVRRLEISGRFLRDFRKAAADADGDREAVWVLFRRGNHMENGSGTDRGKSGSS